MKKSKNPSKKFRQKIWKNPKLGTKLFRKIFLNFSQKCSKKKNWKIWSLKTKFRSIWLPHNKSSSKPKKKNFSKRAKKSKNSKKISKKNWRKKSKRRTKFQKIKTISKMRSKKSKSKNSSKKKNQETCSKSLKKSKSRPARSRNKDWTTSPMSKISSWKNKKLPKGSQD